ncbi:MAG: galactokinase [Actinomycetota bacterium]|nr:galactokinase [Actinomycetota bacterium]MDQ3629360.1 galactokinase [Actinomycetota bacterium]
MTTQRWSAPGRVNLIGEHLDYLGGPVLPIAIDRRTTVEAAGRGDTRVQVRSDRSDQPVEFDVSTRPGEVTGWAAYVAGTVWAMREAGHDVPGLDLAVGSDVPLGAGLSSSAALECAVAVAVRDIAGLDIDDVTLALLAQHAENDYVGMPCGAMDQLASTCGRTEHALLIDTAAARPVVRPVPAGWAADKIALLVMDTRASHELTDGGYATRRAESERAARQLGLDALARARVADLDRLEGTTRRRAAHVVSETARVHASVEAMAARDWARLGELFTASHASLRDDYEVSCPELDVAVDTALAVGALGARMTGAGFGGSAIALVGDAAVHSVTSAVHRAFQREGFDAPDCFTVSPADGAHAHP